MSDPIMTLSENDLHHIGQYVRAELPGWLKELGPWALGSELLERSVRVEEELKSQREILLAHVQATDRRFEDVNRRFEDMNRRFEDVNQRFDDVNKRFDDVNKRFDDVNKRFDEVNKRQLATQWAIGVGFVVLTTLVTLYRFLG